MLEKLEQSIREIAAANPSEERKALLNQLKDAIKTAITNNGVANLNFICTHNSRRSHLSQLWAQTAAAYHGFGQKVVCYSGGTEATALFPAVAETLKSQGYEILKLSQETNPVYAIKYAENQPAVIGFSKAYHHPFNPKSEYIAVMTCDSANEACPVVVGASNRIPLTYEDPKLFDDTPEKMAKYLERSEQIAGEMLWIFNELKKQLQ
ncbi:arsenate reductase/protein-tyrosine-phosphatase family protein [Robertkochia sediminum]|uniref:arsenate reductase/protein-tyrosine-phosphatase family protein n=1 Tax=Robertkochia sediminum TaxID=2785326 RepID=UPI00193120D4|nr:protein-tyrosine-phosphatase [Robertkochia sediminum]MBL7473972.1 protein-tyrosine-phosphatase [Robertkochia sediminum]